MVVSANQLTYLILKYIIYNINDGSSAPISGLNMKHLMIRISLEKLFLIVFFYTYWNELNVLIFKSTHPFAVGFIEDADI